MYKIKVLYLVTKKLMSEITKYENSKKKGKEDKTSLNRNILLILGYMNNKLKQNSKISKEDIMYDFIFPTSKISVSSEMTYLFPQKNYFFDNKNSSKIGDFLYEENPIITSENKEDIFTSETLSNCFDSFEEILNNSDIITNTDTGLPNNDNSINDRNSKDVIGFDIGNISADEFHLKKGQTKNLHNQISDDMNDISEPEIRKSKQDKKSKNGLFSNFFSFFNKKNQNEEDIETNKTYIKFKLVLPPKTIKKYLQDMNEYYLDYMLHHFNAIGDCTIAAKHFEAEMMIKQYKKFLLKLGISEKEIYEDILRNVIYKNKEFGTPNFENFLSYFNKLLKIKNETKFIKYNFLLKIICQDLDEEYVDINHIYKFFNLIRCKMVYEPNIYNLLKEHLISNYYRLYGNKDSSVFRIIGISTVLEEFFY